MHRGMAEQPDRLRTLPYRLPEILATIKAGETVFVVEGKDADALAEIGLAATTNHGGAEMDHRVLPAALCGWRQGRCDRG